MGSGSAATSAAAIIVLRPPQWHFFVPSALTLSMDMKTATTSSTELAASFAVGMVDVRATCDPCLEMATSRRHFKLRDTTRSTSAGSCAVDLGMVLVCAATRLRRVFHFRPLVLLSNNPAHSSAKLTCFASVLCMVSQNA